jgi:hypothetical protein
MRILHVHLHLKILWFLALTCMNLLAGHSVKWFKHVQGHASHRPHSLCTAWHNCKALQGC